MSFIRHIIALLALPIMMLVFMPAIILNFTDSQQQLIVLPYLLVTIKFILSIILFGCGLFIAVANIITFAKIGKGTLAPWDPPKKLVIHGMYRYVRNPMISGVMMMLIAEFFYFFTLPIGIWMIVFIGIVVILIPLGEERELEKKFGDDYTEYKKHVPRWIPRFTPWDPEQEEMTS